MKSTVVRLFTKLPPVIAIAIVLFVVLVAYAQVQTPVTNFLTNPATAQERTEDVSQSNNSVEQALDSEGRLKDGVVGSFDTRGYRMTLGPNSEPRFIKAPNNIPDGGLGGPSSEQWGGGFRVNGANAQIHAMVADSAGNLYVGGDFTVIGDVAANYVAKWDGENWSALGNGIGTGNNSIRAMAIVGDFLYVGGQFSGPSAPGFNIGRWNTVTQTWSNVSNGISGFVYAMTTDGTNLYIGGSFPSTAGGADPVVSMANVGKWNGASWSALGSGVNNPVYALAMSGSTLFVGGQFTTAGGSSANRIAKFDTSASVWSALGSGVNDQVLALATTGSTVYAGGIFTTAGGSPANKFAKWDDATSTWSAVGSGTNNTVLGIAISGSDIYITGPFTGVSGSTIPAQRVAKWDGTSWTAPVPGLNNAGRALAVVGTDVYIGGIFTTAGGLAAKYLAKWDGSSTWTSSPGIDGSVSAIAVGTSFNGARELYVGGSFSQVGGIKANNIAKWTRFGWQPVGCCVENNGVNGGVRAIAVSGTTVYVGGFFTEAGGAPANYIAKFNELTGNWSALGLGTGDPGIVLAIAAQGSNVYVGGFFTQAGGAPANFIAKWDDLAGTWSSLGGGTNGLVFALAMIGSDLFAGGEFTSAGGTSANNIAKWDGSSWTALGAGTNGGVYALATTVGNDLYVGGSFTTAGVNPANNIAIVENGIWYNMGDGVPGTVYSLAGVSSTNSVYVGGAFTVSEGGPGNHIAVWSGGAKGSWSNLGSGTNSDVNAIAVRGNSVFIGGDFTLAGGGVSGSFGRYFLNAFTGSVDSNWFNPSNWTRGVPSTGGDDVIINGNASLNSLGRVGDLQINPGYTITLVASAPLEVYGPFVLGGEVDGNGTVTFYSSETGLVRLGSGCIKTRFGRFVGGDGTEDYLFPVGTASGCSPLSIENVVGDPLVYVQAFEGAYTDPATGLPTNRLARWWRFDDTCLSAGALESPQGCIPLLAGRLILNYLPGEISAGIAGNYKLWNIGAGSAELRGGTNDTTRNRLAYVFNDIPFFNDLTLAEITTTAAPAVIAGRVLDANGRPVANASVLMTKPNGDVVTVKTNNFGRYSFTGITSGETYVVMAQTRQHLYMPKVVSLSDDLTDLDFRP